MEAYEGQTVRLRPPCPMCQVPMDPGYIRDRGDSDVSYPSEWIAGAPKHRHRWIGGVKLKNTRRYVVTVFRCERCGYLASYALTPLNDVQPEA